MNEQLLALSTLLNTDRRSGLTIAPEAAGEDLRRRIGKQITTEDLLAGCRGLFEQGFDRVKLYFMCGLPGETNDDLDGILQLATKVSRLGKEVRGRFAQVTVSVANFVPKPNTPLQWHAMQTREYFDRAHQYLRTQQRWKTVDLKYHDVESSLLEGVVSRGTRRVGEAIELAWRRGRTVRRLARTPSARALVASIRGNRRPTSTRFCTSRERPTPPLPWDHIGIRQGRDYLVREWDTSTVGSAQQGH